MGSRVQGMVVDSLTHCPTMATISLDGDHIASTDRGGRFSFVAETGRHYTFQSSRYISMDVEYAFLVGPNAIVELIPNSEVRIHFAFEDGTPCAGVSTALTGTTGECFENSTYTALSSQSGDVVIPTAHTMNILYQAPSGQSGELSLVPGEGAVITIYETLRKLILRYESGEPIAGVGVEFRAGSLGRDRAIHATTDSSGQAHIAGVTGPQVVTLDSPATSLVAFSEGGQPRDIKSATGGGWVVGPASTDEDLELVYSDTTVSLDVLDSKTLAPVSATGTWGIERPVQGTSNWRGLEGGFSILARSGLARIPTAQLDVIRRRFRPDQRITFLFDGFRSWSTTDVESVEDGLKLMVEQCSSRSLRLLGPSGGPFRGKVRIVDALHGRNVESAIEANAEGLTPSLPWSGGAWSVTSLGGESLAEVPASLLSTSSVVDVVVGIEAGTIRVLGAPLESLPPLASLFWISDRTWNGRLTEASPGEEEGEWVFDALTPGEYIVGPSGFVQWFLPPRSHSQPRPLPTVRVQSGRETVVHWDPAWAVSPGLSGVITAPGAESRLRVFSLFAVPGSRSTPGLLRSRVPLDARGRYTIRRGTAIPDALLVTVEVVNSNLAWNGFIPIGLLPPGENAALDVTPVKLRWVAPEGQPQPGLVIALSLDDSLAEELSKYLGLIDLDVYWPAGQNELEIPCLGPLVRQFKIRSGFNVSGVIPWDARRLDSDRFFMVQPSDLGATSAPGSGALDDGR